MEAAGLGGRQTRAGTSWSCAALYTTAPLGRFTEVVLFRILTLLLLLLSVRGFAAGGEPGDVGLGGRWAQRDSSSSFYVPRHRRIVFQFDTRYSMVSSQRATVNGLKLGVEWRSRLRMGIGLYVLSPTTRVNVKPGADWPEGTLAHATFRYGALYGEYVLLGNPRWEISLPVQFGMGRYWVQYTDPDGLRSRSTSQRLFLLEPTIAAQMRVFRWIGVGGGMGWRQVLNSPLPPDQSINGPIFYLRAKLYLGDLLRTVRRHQPLFTQKGLRKADWKRPGEVVLDDDSAE